MTSATVNGTTTTFAYRGDGLRDSRTVGMTTTQFTWDINAGLSVVLDDGNQYVYGAGLESMVTATGSYYYLADGLGSTMAVVDSTGAVQKSYTYDVYGKPTATGSLGNEFDFAGQQTDASTGLQYLRARYMDPETGAFTSRDPLAAGASSTGHPFGYAACNAVRYGDPAGLKPADDGDDRNMSAREKLCWGLVGDMLKRIVEMREDRDVIEGRGTGRAVSDDDKVGKQRRWRLDQGALNGLWERFQRYNCPKVIGLGWMPDDFDEQLNGEYPKFKASSKSWWDKIPRPDVDVPEVPDNIWWNNRDWWKNPPVPVPAPYPVHY